MPAISLPPPSSTSIGSGLAGVAASVKSSIADRQVTAVPTLFSTSNTNTPDHPSETAWEDYNRRKPDLFISTSAAPAPSTDGVLTPREESGSYSATPTAIYSAAGEQSSTTAEDCHNGGKSDFWDRVTSNLSNPEACAKAGACAAFAGFGVLGAVMYGRPKSPKEPLLPRREKND